MAAKCESGSGADVARLSRTAAGNAEIAVRSSPLCGPLPGFARDRMMPVQWGVGPTVG
jgi:hypothetical protein